MCGLVGIAGDLQYVDEGTMRRLLLLDYLRGTDSTGMAAIGKEYDWSISKIASHPIDLFDTLSFRTALTASKSRAFIGHNRAATRGLVNAVNAHPYEYRHIVGAHNGTLDKASWDRLEAAVGESFGTDSNAIFAAIAKLGVEEAVGLMEEGKNASEGAWALTWYDGKENTINFLKNRHRPLYIGTVEEGDKIIWASEWEMMDYATGAASPKYDFHFVKEACFFPLPDDEWHSYDLEKLAAQMGGPMEPTVVKDVKGRQPVAKVVTDPFGRDVDGWDQYDNVMGFHAGTSTTSSSTTTSRGTSELVNVLNVDGDEGSPYAGFVSKADFEQYARGGCSWCKGPVKFTDVGCTVFEKESHILCDDCSPGTGNRVYIDPQVFRNLI